MSYIVSPCKDDIEHTHQPDFVQTFLTGMEQTCFPKPFAKVSVRYLYCCYFIL